MKTSGLLCRCVIAAALLYVANSASGNLITNGGFETGDFTGWTLSGQQSNVGVASFAAHSGNFGAFAGPNPPATENDFIFLSQTVTTVPGQLYDISLFLTTAQPGPPNDDIFDVFWGSDGIDHAFTFPSTYSQLNFLNHVATSNSTNLVFVFRHHTSSFFLDDVSVTASLPESVSTFWLALVVVVMIAPLHFRKSIAAKAGIESAQ